MLVMKKDAAQLMVNSNVSEIDPILSIIQLANKLFQYLFLYNISIVALKGTVQKDSKKII